MFTQSEANCTLIKNKRGLVVQIDALLECRLQHLHTCGPPCWGKPQRIPEGGAVIGSAVITNDCGGAIDSALRCRLSTSEGAGCLVRGREKWRGRNGEEGVPPGHCTMGGLSASDQ